MTELMGLLEWAMKVLTVIGLLAVLFFFAVGFMVIYSNVRAQIELWKARKHFERFGKLPPKIQDALDNERE